jgi:hypothetical protein
MEGPTDPSQEVFEETKIESTEQKVEIQEKIFEKNEKPKRKYTKRKHLAEEKGEALREETQEEPVEPQQKRVRVTTQEETQEEEPSLWRGGLIKPLLVAALASASFYVNHVYKTTTPKPAQKKKVSPQKTVHNRPPNFVLQSKSERPSVVPGFTV